MTRLPSRPIAPKRKPVRNHIFRRLWSAMHTHCMNCGIGSNGHWLGLQTHHICKPGRSDEACNFLRLCAARCHPLAEGAQIRENGVVLPCLSLANCLWLKMERTPDEWDPERLAVLLGECLPPQIAPDPIYLDQYRQRRQP